MLTESLAECASAPEASFGVGLSPGSREAKELLGGAQRFDVVELELWTLGEY